MNPSADPAANAGFAANATALLKAGIDWPFLDEPVWRWAVFLVVMGGFLGAWSGVIRHMKS